jgi:predicted ATPase
MPAEQPPVGRRAELAVLDRLLDDLTAGRPGVVAVTGEPGMGKTAVLSQLAERARARGCEVVPGCPAALLSTVDDVRSARAGTLVLLLDDLHRADAAAIDLLTDLLTGLLRRPPAAPVLLALAFRPRQAPPGLLAALAPAPGEARTWLDLPPLTRAETDELLDRVDPALPALRRRELYESSGGNPGYLRALREPGSAGFVAELAALPAGARMVALAAAVAGDPFDPELVSAIAEITVAAALAGIDELAPARPGGSLCRGRVRDR